MTYQIIEITDKKIWDNFQDEAKLQTMLQTWEWGQHYILNNTKVWYLGLEADGKLVCTALIVKISARRGTFLLCPHGPSVLDDSNQLACLKHITAYCEQLAKAEKCGFLRFCPLLIDTDSNRRIYKTLGFKNAPIHMHTELAWILDITKSEEELLKDMRMNTRYNINKSQRDGLVITTSSDPEDIEKFWPLYIETTERQKYTPFKKKDIKAEFELFSKEGNALFFFAHHEDKIIAASIIIFSKFAAFYHHSGSANRFNNVKCSYLLQWRAIQEAKKRGCKYYNFLGISPENKPKHPWTGLSQFKRGFGGFEEAYVHAQDKPIHPKYLVSWAIESIRKIKRGL